MLEILCLQNSLHMLGCLCVCIFVCVCVSVFMCVNVCLYVCVCARACVCNPCESGRLTRFSPVNRGDTPNRGAPRFLVVVAPWSERCV